MNKDFWNFLSYSDKLSIALNVIMSGGIFMIYQEDPERERPRIFLEYLGKGH